MNAWIVTLVAFVNCRKLNFISVTSSVLPTTSTSDAGVDERTHGAAEQDCRADDDTRADETD